MVCPLANAGTGFEHSHQQLRQRAFAAAGLSNNAQRFAPMELEIQPVEGVNLLGNAPQPVFARGKVHVHAVQFKQNVRHGVPPVAGTSMPPVGLQRHVASGGAFRRISRQRQSSAREMHTRAEAG